MYPTVAPVSLMHKIFPFLVGIFLSSLPSYLSSSSYITFRISSQISQVIEGIAKAANLQDDIIVWGNTRKELHQSLKEVLYRVQKSGVKLNLPKCKFEATAFCLCKFTGNLFKFFVCKMIDLFPHSSFVLQSKLGIQLFSHPPTRRLQSEGMVRKM